MKISAAKRRHPVLHASITVEAAFVFPVFIFALTAFLYLFQLMNIQEALQNGLTQTAQAASRYAYLYRNAVSEDGRAADEAEILRQLTSGIFYKTQMRRFVHVDEIDRSCIAGGFDGIDFSKSTFMDDSERIDVVITYTIKLDVPLIPFMKFKMVQRCAQRGFVGTEERMTNLGKEDQEQSGGQEDVYISATGTVYHLNKSCTHLKLNIRITGVTALSEERNEYGGRYKPCELCTEGKGIIREEIYVTSDGDRYHYTIDCSGLKRTILTIAKKDVGNRSLCSRCGGKTIKEVQE